MSVKETIELVCFDVGGVLVRIHGTWSEACQGARLDVRRDAAGAGAELARRELNRAHTLGEMSMDQWILGVKKGLGSLYTPEEIAAIHDAVLIDEYPRVDALIDDLHGAGIATACLSNTNDAHWAKLVHHDGSRALPGDPRYPTVKRLGSRHASHVLGLAKPDPAIFRAFERATGRAGARILFFDDLLENVAAARALGWRAERIDPTRPTDEQMRRHLAVHGVL